MKISEIANITSSEIIYQPESVKDLEFLYVVAADLMSEIMLDTSEKSVIVTGLINPQVVRTAEMMDVFAAIFVRGKEVRQEIVDLAKDRGIAIMSTKLSMFEVCGILYSKGLKTGQ